LAQYNCSVEETNQITNAENAYESCLTSVGYDISKTCQTCLPNYANSLSAVPCMDLEYFDSIVSLTCSALGCGSSCQNMQCQYPPAGSCDFYLTCVENVTKCGASGYALDFGYRYCNAFLQIENTFSPQGLLWSQYVRHCLQTKVAVMPISTMTCDQIASSAIASHEACYMERAPGDPTPTFCDLTWGDRGKIGMTISGVLFTSRIWAIAKQGAGIQFIDCWGKQGSQGLQNLLVKLDVDISNFAAQSDQAIEEWASALESSAIQSVSNLLTPSFSIQVSGFQPGSVIVGLAVNVAPNGTNGSSFPQVVSALQQNIMQGKVNTTYPVQNVSVYHPTISEVTAITCSYWLAPLCLISFLINFLQ